MDTTARYSSSATGTPSAVGPEMGRVPTLVFSVLSGLCALPPLGIGLWLLAAYAEAPRDDWASLVGTFGLVFMGMGLAGVAGLWLGLYYRFRNPQAGLVFAILGFVIALLPCLFGVAWWSPGQPQITAKGEAGVALASPGGRRVRGWAAMQVFTAFLLAETATRRTIAFLKNPLTDDEGHIYQMRRKRTGDHSPTGMPPGGAAQPNAPPVIDLPAAA